MNKIFLGFLLVLIPALLSAQNNESDTLKFKADLALTGFWQAGNVETLIFRAKSEVRYRPWKKLEYKTRNSYVYQEFGRQKADEDILSLNFLSYAPERKIYPQVLAFVSTNFRRDIDLRYLLGAGATVKILNSKKSRLTVSITSEYERTDFGSSDFNLSEYDGNRSIETIRGTVWINGRYSVFNNKLILTHESYYQPSLEETNNYRWQADIGIELPVWKFLNLKINFVETFESIVIEGQKQGDEFLTFGFTVKSY